MKVIAINGSARKDGNTAILIRHVFEELTKEGIETELIQLAGHAIRGLRGLWHANKSIQNSILWRKETTVLQATSFLQKALS